jgi:hypothetical protein
MVQNRPKGRQEVVVPNSDLVEIARRSGDFKKHYGKWLGSILYLCSVNAAAGRRPFLWAGLVSLGTAAASLVLKYVVPSLPW